MKWTRSAFIAVFSILLSRLALASVVTPLGDGALSALVRPAGPRMILNLPLYPRSTARITLDEFQVWAPGAKVVIHDGGKVTMQDPPPMRFFRGEVANDPESFAYFSVELSTGKVTGLVATRDERYAIDGYRRAPHPRERSAVDDDFAYMLTASDPTDARDMTSLSWQCAVEKSQVIPQAALKNVAQPIGANGLPVAPEALTGTQTYSIRVEVETDYELYQNAGSNATTLTTYVTNLTGAVSTIYNRDLKTNVLQQNLHVYTNSSDPWAATNSLDGLDELGDYYHTTYPGLARSAVVQLSGKNYPGGIAWEGVICWNEVLNGAHWAGPYAWCGMIGNGGFGSIPDPNATVSGVQYGMPSGTQNYWPLAEYAHELGHVMGGHHTHCVAITDAERIANGFTDGSPATSASNFVDHCYGQEGDASCYGGVATTTSYVSGSETIFNGTVMSYCHNVFVGGVPQSRFVFGPAAEPSHHELDDYMMRAAGPIAGGGNTNIVEATTATMSAITSGASVNASSTGNTASVTNVAGQTYAWTITGGSITAGGSTNSVTFTAGASGNVVLRVATYGSNNCGVTDTKTIPIVSAAAPTVTSLNVTSGPTIGGTAVVITGTNFVNGAGLKVTFGGTVATVTFVSSTTLNVVTPQRTAGAVDVVVTNPDLQTGTKASAFTYTLTTATVTSVTPNAGSATGGTAVTIAGTQFFGTVSVTFGGTAATSVNRASSTSITCTTPAHAAGAVNVVVTNGDGGTATLTNGYTYQAPAPTVTSLNVTSGPTIGGTAVVITGTNFVNGAGLKVTFGGTVATVTFVNSTTLNVVTPQRTAAGAVDVVVTNPDLQTGTKASAFTYTLTTATVTSVTPNAGSATGGTAVTIAGTQFFGTVSVTFGGSAATSVNRASSTSITCTTPAHAAGAVNAVVTNGDGGTATLTNGFTYQALPPTITSLNVTSGPATGGTAVTITGTNFVNPATVDFGGAAATGVNVASATSITCTTPAHAVGLVDVTVTTGGQPVTKTGAFTFNVVPLPNGDVNGNGVVDAADVVYLANYLFAGGPAPVGSGDVNGDTQVNALDLFYLVNYLFASGAAPTP